MCEECHHIKCCFKNVGNEPCFCTFIYKDKKKQTNPVAFFQMCFRSNQVQSFFYEKDLGYKVPLVRGCRFIAERMQVHSCACSSSQQRFITLKGNKIPPQHHNGKLSEEAKLQLRINSTLPAEPPPPVRLLAKTSNK